MWTGWSKDSGLKLFKVHQLRFGMLGKNIARMYCHSEKRGNQVDRKTLSEACHDSQFGDVC